MKCEHCGSDGFNRIVLDREKQQMIGAMCRDCEDQLRAGDLGAEEFVSYTDTIELVEPRFALPLLDLVVSDPEEGEFYLEYTLDGSTPHLTEIIPSSSEKRARDRTKVSG